MSSLAKRCCAEMLGTGLLVFFGAGAAAITMMIASGTSPVRHSISESVHWVVLRTGLLSGWPLPSSSQQQFMLSAGSPGPTSTRR